MRGHGDRAAGRNPDRTDLEEFGDLWAAGHDQDVHGSIDGGDQGLDVVDCGQAWRVEDIGAGLLIGLQSRDRIGEVGIVSNEILRSCGQYQRRVTFVVGRDRCANPLRGEFRVVDLSAAEVFDRSTRNARLAGSRDRLGRCFRFVAESVFEIRIDG